MRGNLKHDNPYVTMKRFPGYVVSILFCCICLSIQPIYAEFTEEKLLNPESLSAEDWFEIGNIFLENIFFDDVLGDAVGSWHNAMTLNPDLSANAWYHIGIAYAAAQQHSDAASAWENSAAIKQANLQLEIAEGLFDTGSFLLDNDKLDDAIESFHNAMYFNPSLAANAWYNIGLAYATAQQYSDAISAWENTIKLQPDSAMAYNNLGTAYAILGMADESLAAYDMAIKIAPNEPKYKADRATLVAALGGIATEKETPLSPLLSIIALCAAMLCIVYMRKNVFK